MNRVAAVPASIGNTFQDAPPGHRYSLYLEYWQRENEWKPCDTCKQKVIEKVGALPESAKKQMKELGQRLDCLSGKLPEENCLVIYGRSSAPFVTGMGIEHPLENGFAFLSPYGLPYLPGSSIKGVLRRAACELCADEESDWSQEWIRELFGDKESECRGALVFWDCVPELKGEKMSLDVMTPHYGEYYRGKETPHDAGSPNPIVFLTVPDNSGFIFTVSLAPKTLSSEKLRDGGWKEIMKKAFDLAFDWIGFGAKTAVGYGAMNIDQDARDEVIQKRKMEDEQKKQNELEEKRRNEMTPVEREIDSLSGSLPQGMPCYRKIIKALEEGNWTSPDDISEAASLAKEEMQGAKKWKEITKAKRPEKDKDYQDTLRIKKFLDD